MSTAEEQPVTPQVEESPLEDLVVITGVSGAGKSTAMEVFVPERQAPIVLAHDTAGLQLLQRARDEAHRFAVSHHRSRRDKAMTASALDSLPGVGPARRKALIAHFGTPEAVLAASREELEGVPGLPQKVARDLHGHLRRPQG